MLYSRYANPKELLRIYVKQGRFGEFVSKIIESENKRKQEEAVKENENKLFLMYVHSFSDKSFMDWKNEVLYRNSVTTKDKAPQSGDAEMTEDEMIGIIDRLFSKC